MTIAIAMHGPGGPDVLQPIEIDLPDPGPGEVRIRQSVVGVNFVDIYYRTGLYPPVGAPAVLGFEGAGRVEAVGPDVLALRPGDRVAYHGRPIGAYAAARILPAGRLVTLPDTLSDRVVGGTMLRGLTAHMLLHAVRAVQPGDWILVHAAAGGLGQLVTRWAKRLGVRVIGTVGAAGKRVEAEAAGADAVFLRGKDDWVACARTLADGRGVHLAIDGIGGDLLTRTLAAVRPFGTVASIGQAAGLIPPISIMDLGANPAVALTRPSVIAYADDPDRYRLGCSDLMAALQAGLINPIGAEYPLRDAARAHADLEAGRTTGSLILTV